MLRKNRPTVGVDKHPLAKPCSKASQLVAPPSPPRLKPPTLLSASACFFFTRFSSSSRSFCSPACSRFFCSAAFSLTCSGRTGGGGWRCEGPGR